MSTVVIVKCESYGNDEVGNAVERGIQLLGGMSRFVKRGENILLKPNMLAGDSPEKCVTTHPSIVRAAAKALIAAGATVSCGDSPAIGSTVSSAKKCGFTQVADELGFEIAEFSEGGIVHFNEGRQNKQFTIANAVTQSDGIISLPKLKTHGFEKFTGCIKNQFGCIPGFLKGEFHVKIPDAYEFAKMLVDLDNCVHPRLYIMDGIMAMEGNGPRGGSPKKMNVILLSTDPVALDATACRMIGVDTALVPTVTCGAEAGRGTFDEKEIELAGDPLADFIAKDFDIDRSKISVFRSGKLIKFVNSIIVPKPVINNAKCIACGICVKMCPVQPKAVDWYKGDTKKPPRHNYRLCIRCYCCQELCPQKAIDIKKPLLRKLMGLLKR
jgi:uncharacterized protein (DUF362 family)